MKDIRESFISTEPLSTYVNDRVETPVDEGLRDVFNMVKNKFKQAFQWMRGVVAKIGSYFLPVNENGEIQPAITPMTAGQAYKDGAIDKNNTLVCLRGEAKKIVKLNTKPEKAIELYGKGNSIDYWETLLRESEERGNENAVNEVKLASEDPEAKYAVISDNKELEAEIMMCIKHPKDARLMIWGAPGIGKTAIVMAVVDTVRKESNPDFQIIFKTLSNETPDNFTLPKYVEIDGQSKATDVPKTWLPVYKPTGDAAKDAELDKATGAGLLFIDELSRATPQVLNVVLPLVNEGEFNGYKVGSNWTIVCASNRPEDEMSGQSSIGNALGNRFSQVWYEPTFNSWEDWAKNQNFISPLLLQWLALPKSENMSGAKYFYMDPNEEMEGASVTTLMCTPRSWTNAMRKLARYSHTGTLEGFSIFDIPERIIKRTLNTCVPAQAIDAFWAFLIVIHQIGDFDAAVRDVWTNGGASFKIKKADLNKIMLPLAQLICTSHNDKIPTEKEFMSLCKWLVSLKSDQMCSYVLDVFKNTFFGEFSGDGKMAAMLIHMLEEEDKAKGDTVAEQWKNFAKTNGWEAHWGMKLSDIPDYYPAIEFAGKTYADAFLAAKVDGVDALG